MFVEAAKNLDSRFFEERYPHKRSKQQFSILWILNSIPNVRENYTKCKVLIISSVISNLGDSLFVVLHKCPFSINTWGAQFFFPHLTLYLDAVSPRCLAQRQDT